MSRLQDQISFRISADERAELEQLARSERRSVAYMAREGVRLVIGRSERDSEAEHPLPSQAA